MTITSKYDGKCKKCGGFIAKGQEIEWSKEGGSQHTVCPAKPALSYKQETRNPQPSFPHLEKAYKKAETAVNQKPETRNSKLVPDPYWELLYQQAEQEHQFVARN